MSVARHQRAKSWELRAATTLARLLASRGDHAEAHAVLAPVYGWFTEGHDTRDLKEAAELLAELGAAQSGQPSRKVWEGTDPTKEHHDGKEK